VADTKEIIKLILEFLLRYGFVGFLIVVLFLLIHDPERAIKLKALLFEPLFRFTKWGSKQYIGAKVSSQVTDFLKHHVIGKLSNRDPLRIKVKWVTSPSDPVLKRDGTVILRMRETPDQTRNVLTATQLVLPYTLFTLLRPTLDKSVRTAIDLVILNKMAIKLGNHARAIFQRHFLTPETEGDKRVAELFTQLVELDSGGLFVSIFLEELETLADNIYARADFLDKSNEVGGLLDYLLTIVRRKIGQEIELDYHSPIFHIGVIIVAKSVVAEAKGIGPYTARLQKKLNQGCETVYLIAYAHKESFLSRVMDSIEQEDRVLIEKEAVVNLKGTGEGSDRAYIVRLQRNNIFTDDIFAERLRVSGVKLGDVVQGIVTDVSQEQAMVTVKGLNACVLRNDACWQSITTCHEVLALGDRCDFRVKAIRKDIGELQLSLRLPAEDPWKTTTIPAVGEFVDIEVVRDCGMNYLCRLPTGLELALPKAEISWLAPSESPIKNLAGTRQEAVIYEVDADQRLLRCSMRRLEEDPWPKVLKRFPKGTVMRGKVIKTTPHFVHVDLGEGIVGGVPRASMIAAGFEYATFENSVVPGQGLDVVVRDVLVSKRIIILDLQRNLSARSPLKSRAKTSGRTS